MVKHLPLSIWADDDDTFSPRYIAGPSSSYVHEPHREEFPGLTVGRKDLITWLARSPHMRLLVYVVCRVMSNEQSKENEMSGACGKRGEEKYVGKPEGNNNMEDIGVYRRIVLKLILKGVGRGDVTK
jgi:hypothetical protein